MARTAGARGRLSESILVKLSPEQAMELDAAALVQGVSSPELIRTALDEFLRGLRNQIRKVIQSVEDARRSLKVSC